MRDWETNKILNQYNLDNYKKEWGNVYNMLHRQDMHVTLLKTATSPDGLGVMVTRGLTLTKPRKELSTEDLVLEPQSRTRTIKMRVGLRRWDPLTA